MKRLWREAKRCFKSEVYGRRVFGSSVEPFQRKILRPTPNSMHIRATRIDTPSPSSRTSLRSSQIYYCCDRGSYKPKRSKPLTPTPGHPCKQMRSLRRTGYEYTVFIRYSKKQRAWIVSESKNHNHTATEDPNEQPVHRRLQPTENQQLAEPATGGCWRSVLQISRMLN